MSRKRTSAGFLILAAGLFAAGAAHAGTDADVRAGVNTDANAMEIGGGLLTNIDRAHRWYFNPNVEVAVDDNDGNTDVSLNGDFHYDFPTESSVSPYVGAGPAVLLGGSNSDVGANVFGGIADKRGDVRPFGQLKGVVSDNSTVLLMAGIRF